MGFKMKIKVLLTALILLTLFSAAALAAIGPAINQDIGQSSNQAVSGRINNSTVNQSTAQMANQNVQGRPGSTAVNQNIGQASNQGVQGTISNTAVNQTTAQNAGQNIQGAMQGNVAVNQGTTQTGNQSVQGTISNTTINQNLVQSSNQSIYFITNTQPVTITSEQKTILGTTTEQFLTSFPSMRMFIMPVADLQQFVTAGRADVVVVDVSLSGTPVAGFPNAIIIPLNQLANRINEIPTGRTIAVVSDSDMISAEAMTILRMQGFNAWAVKTGVC